MSGAENLVAEEVVGFRLTRALGAGGMATVYRGESVLDSSIVRAIKVVRAELAERPEFVQRFAEEARVLERLDHPNVVKFFGVRKEQDRLVMELELLDGAPLSSRSGGQAPPLHEAVGWVAQACEGVAAAHAIGVVHRDLKPDNLFLSGDTVKVLDFGIARALDDADRAVKITGTGQNAPGSPAYMAPEVCQGQTPDPSSDVYALGMSLYELVLGYHPFEPPGQDRLTQLQLMQAQVAKELPRLDALRPEVPTALAEVAARATAKTPAERMPTARELADALRGVTLELGAAPQAKSLTSFALPDFVPGTPSGPVTLPSGAPADGGSGRSAPWGLIAAVLATLGLGGGAAWVMTRPPPPEPERTSVAVAPAPAPEPEPEPEPELNPWVRIEPPRSYSRKPIYIGLQSRRPPKKASGFRRSRKIPPPQRPFEIQQHEVTFQEFEPWAKEQGLDFKRPAWASGDDASAFDDHPVAGVTWMQALNYCESLGEGTRLPEEEEWALAARGEKMRPYAWGSQPLDASQTHAYRGPSAVPVAVKTSAQDRTPGAADEVLYDMMGNVQEWTFTACRDDSSAAADKKAEKAWRKHGFRSHPCRVVRGLPLRGDGPFPQEGAAVRRFLGSGLGPDGKPNPMALKATKADRDTIGFRCARPATSKRK